MFDVLLLDLGEYAWKTCLWVYRHRERARWWQHVAESCGLTDVVARRALGWNWALEGRSGGLRVRLESRVPRRDTLGAFISIRGFPDSLQGPSADAERLFGGRALREDADVDIPPVAGPPLLLCSLFGPESRRLVRNLFVGRIDRDTGVHTWDAAPLLRGGALTATYEVLPTSSRYELADIVAALLDIARRLEPPADVERAVAERARTDPQPKARQHHLRTLIEHGAPEVAAEARRRALADEAPEVRLEAARASGADGEPVLEALVTGAGVPDACRSAAVRLLGPRLGTDTARVALERALAADGVETAVACLERLTGEGATAVDAIVSALRNERHAVATAAARSLATLAAPAAEPALVAALARAGRVREEAVAALARCGTAEAVLPLQELAGSAGERALARSCRDAVVAIQSRLPGAGRGQVGLAEADAGQLAVADDERGRVALDGPTAAGRR